MRQLNVLSALSRLGWTSFFVMAASVCAACVAPIEEGDDVESESFGYTVPAKGTATTLDVACWNLEWFGDTINGPTNETLQRTNATDVIRGADMDLWALEEVVSVSQFNTMKSALTGYAGFLSNDALVTSGSTYYTSTEQKLGFLYKTSIATVQSAKIILTAKDYDFAGRPPLEVKLSVTLNGSTENVIVIVVHMKASSDAASYTRRLNASTALKSYLDTTYPTQKVFVLGDFNDDLDLSISGNASPFANFLGDPARYQFATKVLTDSGISTTASGGATIDHHLLTNETALALVAGSTQVYRVDSYIPSYSSSTSDHYPILSRYNWAGPPAQVIINEICANEPGADTGGEFIEIVNIGGSPADLNGWTLADATSARHTFPAGTSLAPGKALVVFGTAAAIPAGLGNALASTTGNLGLANAGDAVYLRDSAGTVKDSISYPSSLGAVDGVSMNRSPDATANATFALHTTLSANPRSAGTRATGAAF
jgi:endonuclease/exonuclease/phosphatase family metal-dependent hydrolase